MTAHEHRLTLPEVLEWMVADGLVGKVLFGKEPIQPDDVARAELVYATAGLRAIRLYSLQRPGPAALDAARATPGIELVDLSREAEPATAYCRR